MALILVVDDNKMNRVLVCDILKAHGFEVLEAANGQECLQYIQTMHPDCILLDMQMPVMDGFETTRVIKSNSQTKNIKIIAVTSFAMKGDKERIVELGADEYISKPINTRELPNVIKRVLEQ